MGDPVKAHDGRQVFDEVVAVWLKVADEEKADRDASRFRYGITLGTLTAVKLVMRLDTGGVLEFWGDRKLLAQIDERAARIAGTYFGPVADELFHGRTAAMFDEAGLPIFLGLDLGAPSTDPALWRWCPDAVDTGTSVPSGLDPDVLVDARPLADRVTDLLIELICNSRWAVMEDDRAQRTEVVAQLIGFAAAGKLLLAAWGNGRTAAALECVAERASEAEFERLFHSVILRRQTARGA